jgi:hypothetical protein
LFFQYNTVLLLEIIVKINLPRYCRIYCSSKNLVELLEQIQTMKKSKTILFLGSAIVLILSIKWYFTDNSSFEPIVTIGTSILTILGYYFALFEEKENNESNENGIQRNTNIKVSGNKNKVVIGNNNEINTKRKSKIPEIVSIILSCIFIGIINGIHSSKNQFQPKIDEIQLTDYKPFEKISYLSIPNNTYILSEEKMNKILNSMKEWERIERFKAAKIEDLIKDINADQFFTEDYTNSMTNFFKAVNNKDYTLAHEILNQIHSLSEKAKQIKNTSNLPNFESNKENLIDALNNFDPNLP